MKTVVQELIEKLQELEDNVPYAMEREVVKYCKNLAIDSLEKEKQQIIDFASKCQLVRDVDCDGNVTFCFDPKEQFEKTFS